MVECVPAKPRVIGGDVSECSGFSGQSSPPRKSEPPQGWSIDCPLLGREIAGETDESQCCWEFCN